MAFGIRAQLLAGSAVAHQIARDDQPGVAEGSLAAGSAFAETSANLREMLGQVQRSAIDLVGTSAQSRSTTSMQVSALAHELATTAERLEQLVSRFKLA